MELGSRRGAYVLVSTLCVCSAISMLAVFITVQRPTLGRMRLQTQGSSDIDASSFVPRALHRSVTATYTAAGDDSTSTANTLEQEAADTPGSPKVDEVR